MGLSFALEAPLVVAKNISCYRGLWLTTLCRFWHKPLDAVACIHGDFRRIVWAHLPHQGFHLKNVFCLPPVGQQVFLSSVSNIYVMKVSRAPRHLVGPTTSRWWRLELFTGPQTARGLKAHRAAHIDASPDAYTILRTWALHILFDPPPVECTF